MNKYLSFSIVINTYNRGSFLQKTLESFQYLNYKGEFEVIVVNGPSTDTTDELLKGWKSKVRIGKCPVVNLSVSRNIGICMAKGDIVAFIDDDAIPEAEWLTDLSKPYVNPAICAVGGYVYDHTGYDFQTKHILTNRFGESIFLDDLSLMEFSFPKSGLFPTLIGCNSSFRRSALLEVGGFDEEIDYFLDETDLCLRLIDVGLIIHQLKGAYVHHKFAPSHIRQEVKSNNIKKKNFSWNKDIIVKNATYFRYKHASEFYTQEELEKKVKSLEKEEIEHIKKEFALGYISKANFIASKAKIIKAVEKGKFLGQKGMDPNNLINNEKINQHNGSFLSFNLKSHSNSKNIVLISQDFPPNHNGGIATYTKDLAEALVYNGNIVHVITKGLKANTVDLENGVWIHRILEKEIELSIEAKVRRLPYHIWKWSANALEEVKKISTHREIDVVEAPIWDCEGVAFLLEKKWPLVTCLVTSLACWLEYYPEHKENTYWIDNHAKPLIAQETELLLESDGIHASTKAIVDEIESLYNLTLDKNKLRIIPHGSAVSLTKPNNTTNTNVERINHNVNVLFVGRLEARKGIDVLLQSIPEVFFQCDNVNFRIIGKDPLMRVDGLSYEKYFKALNKNKKWFKKVLFEGWANDETLIDAYSNCDIFVAPSLFESFGLIFLEAMREGKPVIGCSIGGMLEIIEDNVNGFLVKPGCHKSLSKAIIDLVKDANLRKKMGLESKKIFNNKFTSEQAAQKRIEIFDLAKINFKSFI